MALTELPKETCSRFVQSVKEPSRKPIDSTLLGISMVFKLMQPLKVHPPILVIPSAIFTSDRFLQSWKQELGTSSMLLGISMLIILVRANAPDPKYVTLFGMSTYTKEDPSKALTPIDEILLGIFTEFTFEFLKASPSISMM